MESKTEAIVCFPDISIRLTFFDVARVSGTLLKIRVVHLLRPYLVLLTVRNTQTS